MALLKFYAREDKLVREPGPLPVVGQSVSYVGRRWDAALHGYPATTEPYAVDGASAPGQRLATLCVRDASLWAADEATAAACGASFVPVKFVDGAWIAAPKTEAPRPHKALKE